MSQCAVAWRSSSPHKRLRRAAVRAFKLARRRDKEPSTLLVVALVVADLLFVCAVWAILHSPPPRGWSQAPQSAAAAARLHPHPQALQTLIGPRGPSGRHHSSRRLGLS
jgi:hypothetical protein